MRTGSRVSRVNLIGIVTPAVELADFLVRHVLDHLEQFRIGAKEMLTGISATVGFAVLQLTVNDFVHALLQ